MVAEKYEFDVVLAESCEVEGFSTMADALYENGFDDSMISMFKGVVRLCFSREAESLTEALNSALADIRAAGYTPQKAESAGSSRAMLLWSPELEEAQASLRQLYEAAKNAGQRYWDSECKFQAPDWGPISQEILTENESAEQAYEAAQSEFKQAMHALLGLSEEEVHSVYNPNF